MITQNRVAEITRRYRGEMTLQEFAAQVGVGSRQAVHNWELGHWCPNRRFLLRLAARSGSWARDWAREVLAAIDEMALEP